MNVASIFIGLAALTGACVGFIPLLGWLNWLVIPLAAVGLVVGILSKKATGATVNGFVMFFALLRLMLGGGIL